MSLYSASRGVSIDKRAKRHIKARQFENFQASNIVPKSVVNNSKGYIVPNSNTEQFRNSFFCKNCNPVEPPRRKWCDCSLKHVYDIFLDTINDFSLTQMVTQPTRHENTLDLFLTTNPTLTTQVSCQPGLSDHDMVIAHCSLTPTTQKQKPRKVPIFRKADWSKFKSLMRDYQQKFLSSHIGRSVEELWNDFTSTLDLYSSQCIPVKTF